MTRLLATAALLALLSGCGDGQPFFDDGTPLPTDPTSRTDPTDPGDVIGPGLPPGTVNPRPNRDIRRVEARNDAMGGYAERYTYNAANDTFSVDNLAFDGFNVYQRSGQADSQTVFEGSTVGGSVGPGTLGGYAVYEAAIQVNDFLTDEPIDQITPYRAIYGVSTNTAENDAGNRVPRTAFAIVRTGGYVPYGFGGFIYERNGGVTLPPDQFRGQARWNGEYAGMRVFDGAGGMEFTRADAEVRIDFYDFNRNEGVRVNLTNREAFDESGRPIALGNDTEAGELPLPNIRSVIAEGVPYITANGEIQGGIFSSYVDVDGNRVDYEQGVYYGIIAGDVTSGADGGEIVGILVINSDDPRAGRDGVTVQETGGFIVYR